MNNTTNYRIFVEKLPRFRVEAESLRRELNTNLNLSLGEVRLLCVYDLFGFSEELLEKSRYTVFGEVVTDSVTDTFDLAGRKYIAVEYLPGQFDQRAASAVDCVRLIDPEARVDIRSSRLLVFDDKTTDGELAKIRHYYINAVESREKDLSVLSDMEQAEVKPVGALEGFREMADSELEPYCKTMGLAMNADDLREVVKYFRSEGRDPYETELRILDTYWSDHCRHTTFTTELEGITVEESFVKEEIEDSLALYLRIRRELGREHKSLCLMDMATIGARYLRQKGLLDDLEVSEENNACSVYIDVDVDGRTEKWLLQFKNETHNHPTEIEPFGGASTCLGGAIRDPLSGRSYVYQAMRVTGAGNIYLPVSETLSGKLPQSVISKKAAAGYSSYGNQIGLATTHVREIYHDDYVAKRLEVGAVVGAVKAANVRRERPAPGDKIIMFGGRTGRDGIGGATGSSKEHDAKSLETCGSEVQKGNAPEERKLERLFRRPEVTRLVKKSNDFGAGGVSVAIGELADGLDIYLDRVKTKYSGLNSTELAISESQERMSVVVEAKDMEEFMGYCREENIEAVHVADVTDTARMRMFNGDRKVVDLKREFIDSAGAKHYAEARIGAVENRDPFAREVAGETLAERFTNNLKDNNVVSQRGLVEMFDATIGRSTVLMPFGGACQLTPQNAMVAKLPVDGETNTCSGMAWGYNPYLMSANQYVGARMAVVESVTKLVASGFRYEDAYLTFQEYFERLGTSPERWGKPLAALLGALDAQIGLGIASIGGKDSMSGSFEQLDVPPTLVSFATAIGKASRVVSTEFKKPESTVVLIRPILDPVTGCPNFFSLKANYKKVEQMMEDGMVAAASSVGYGGLAEALFKMGLGNRIGFKMMNNMTTHDMFKPMYGSIVLEMVSDAPAGELLGETTADYTFECCGDKLDMAQLQEIWESKLEPVYPYRKAGPVVEKIDGSLTAPAAPKIGVAKPKVIIPVFPGTNCEYDTAHAFARAGADPEVLVIRNLTPADVTASCEALVKAINESQIVMLPGGFSGGDEPDGSAKFIASFFRNPAVTEAVRDLLQHRDGLMLGICNGFQALIKLGLAAYGDIRPITACDPTLTFNTIGRHQSMLVRTRIASTGSPWLSKCSVGDQHTVAISHGEGRFVAPQSVLDTLIANGQIATQYVDQDGNPSMDMKYNPNGSVLAIEGITSPDGRVFGKMGHSERSGEYLYKNVTGDKYQPIFEGGVDYFKI